MTTAIIALCQALAAYYNSAKIRETRELRKELRELRRQIRETANSGNSSLLAELQNDITDAAREYKALFSPSSNKNI